MNIQLVVVRSFGNHAKGDTITDQEAIASILAGPYAKDVVRVQSPLLGG